MFTARYELNIKRNYMEQSPSWGANWFSVTQKIPHISCNTNVRYLIHKTFSLFLIQNHINSVYARYPISWRSISILSFHLRLGLSSGLFPLRFPNKTTMHFPSPPYLPHARLVFSSRSDHPTIIWWVVQIMNFLIMPPTFALIVSWHQVQMLSPAPYYRIPSVCIEDIF